GACRDEGTGGEPPRGGVEAPRADQQQALSGPRAVARAYQVLVVRECQQACAPLRAGLDPLRMQTAAYIRPESGERRVGLAPAHHNGAALDRQGAWEEI